MEYTGTQLFFGGYCKDTSYFDSSTIIPAHLGAKNAFIAAKNVLTDSIQWVWHDSLPNSSIHQIRYTNRAGYPHRLTISGMGNNSMGYLVILNRLWHYWKMKSFIR